MVYDLTDHLSNFIIFHKFSSLPSSINVYKRDYSKFDEIALLNEIKEINWEITFPSDNNPTNNNPTLIEIAAWLQYTVYSIYIYIQFRILFWHCCMGFCTVHEVNLVYICK